MIVLARDGALEQFDVHHLVHLRLIWMESDLGSAQEGAWKKFY